MDSSECAFQSSQVAAGILSGLHLAPIPWGTILAEAAFGWIGPKAVQHRPAIKEGICA
jgi:hypothetical protein